MNRFTHTAVALGTVAALATGAFAFPSIASAALAAEPTLAPPVADHVTQAAKYEQRAAELQAQAEHHAKMAADYRARINPASKQAITYFTLANHCDQKAERYRKAALEALHLAESERSMIPRG